LLVFRDERGFLRLVVREQRLLAVDERLLKLRLLLAEMLLHEGALGLEALLQAAPLGLVLVLVALVELLQAAPVRLVEAAAVVLDRVFLLTQPPLELVDLLLELLVERGLL